MHVRLGYEEPTLASTWEASVGGQITDELLDWPPDVFALTNIVLDRSQAFRFVLSPDGAWPPTRVPEWSEAVAGAGRRWGAWIEDRGAAFPELVREEWDAFREGSGDFARRAGAGRVRASTRGAADPACDGRRSLCRARRRARRVRRRGVRVSRPRPRAAGENRVDGARESAPPAGAAEGTNTADRPSVVFPVRVRARPRDRRQVAQDAGASSGDERALAVRQLAVAALAARGSSGRSTKTRSTSTTSEGFFTRASAGGKPSKFRAARSSSWRSPS
jgi:hypothetical protein